MPNKHFTKHLFKPKKSLFSREICVLLRYLQGIPIYTYSFILPITFFSFDYVYRINASTVLTSEQPRNRNHFSPYYFVR